MQKKKSTKNTNKVNSSTKAKLTKVQISSKSTKSSTTTKSAIAAIAQKTKTSTLAKNKNNSKTTSENKQPISKQSAQQQPQLITRDTTIGDAVQKYPQSAQVFLEYGLHCVGCQIAYWETLEQGARGHGMLDEEIDMMIRDANAILSDPTPIANDDLAIHLTIKAVEKIRSFMKKDEKDAYFRISLQDGGCAGQSYVFSIDKKASKDDITFEKNGLKCAVSKKLIDALKGSTIDYVESLQDSGFKVHNPNATNTCGCGNSFS